MDKEMNIPDIMKITIRELREHLSKLPVIMVGTQAKNNQKIEGVKDGYHYKITKERSVKSNKFCVYVLSVSGSSENRQALIAKLVELLGFPISEFKVPGFPNTDYVYWDAKKVDTEAVF